MNALKTSLKKQDCLLPSLDLNRAMVRMLKGKLLVITQLHLAFSYSYIIYLEGINGNVLDLLQTFQFFQFCPQSTTRLVEDFNLVYKYIFCLL